MIDSKYRTLAPFLVLLLVLASCGGGGTPRGPLGNTVDLRQHLPAEIAALAPSDTEAMEHQAEMSVGNPPARVLIKWRTFKKGQSAYLLSVSFEVVDSARGVELSTNAWAEPDNIGTEDAVLQQMSVGVNWRRKAKPANRAGGRSCRIRADGTSDILPP
ncbi:hypothetical protein ACFLU6_06045 [Acidobacteriota bacterium]